jgi:hypothetical protein
LFQALPELDQSCFFQAGEFHDEVEVKALLKSLDGGLDGLLFFAFFDTLLVPDVCFQVIYPRHFFYYR